MAILLGYLLVICIPFASPQPAVDERTLLFIQRGESAISVRDLPQLLKKEANISVNPHIVAFLKDVKVKSLDVVLVEIVDTSPDTVSCSRLCKFVTDASKILRDLNVGCSPNMAGRVAGGGTKKKYDSDLHVDDPDAKELTHFKRMRMGEVWRLLNQYILRDVRVAVIDSGIDFTDKDLGPMKTTFKNTSGKVINGTWSFITDSPNLVLDMQHGNRVARVLAAKGNNSYGMVGISPNARLISLEVASKGIVKTSDIIEALNMAAQIEVEVLSVSLSSQPFATKLIMRRALRRIKGQGIFLVSSAGNQGTDAVINFLCSHKTRYGICVGALSDSKDYTLWKSSNYGGNVDIAAFGENIHVDHNNRRSGTSYSAPMVSGVVAIMLGLGVPPRKIKRLLIQNASPLSDKGHQIRRESGAMNVLETIKKAIYIAGIEKKTLNHPPFYP